MVRCKCIGKFRNKHGIIIGYRLQDYDGKVMDARAEIVKRCVANNQLLVENLKLTSDNRLVDCCSNEHQRNSTSEVHGNQAANKIKKCVSIQDKVDTVMTSNHRSLSITQVDKHGIEKLHKLIKANIDETSWSGKIEISDIGNIDIACDNDIFNIKKSYGFVIRATNNRIKFQFTLNKDRIVCILDADRYFYYDFSYLAHDMQRIADIILVYAYIALEGTNNFNVIRELPNLACLEHNFEYDTEPAFYKVVTCGTCGNRILNINNSGVNCNNTNTTAAFIDGYVFPLQKLTAQCVPDRANILAVYASDSSYGGGTRVRISSYTNKFKHLEGREELHRLYKILKYEYNAGDEIECISNARLGDCSEYNTRLAWTSFDIHVYPSAFSDRYFELSLWS